MFSYGAEPITNFPNLHYCTFKNKSYLLSSLVLRAIETSIESIFATQSKSIGTCIFFLTAANFQWLFLKKREFWDNSHNFYYFGKKIRSRRHLPYLSKLTIVFSKNMSKFRENNHFLFVLIFYTQVQINDFWHFCYEVHRFSQLEKCLRINFSPLMSIIWAF